MHGKIRHLYSWNNCEEGKKSWSIQYFRGYLSIPYGYIFKTFFLLLKPRMFRFKTDEMKELLKEKRCLREVDL